MSQAFESLMSCTGVALLYNITILSSHAPLQTVFNLKSAIKQMIVFIYSIVSKLFNLLVY
jgi:hypothetical protein